MCSNRVLPRTQDHRIPQRTVCMKSREANPAFRMERIILISATFEASSGLVGGFGFLILKIQPNVLMEKTIEEKSI
jgi:hypothetical protein